MAGIVAADEAGDGSLDHLSHSPISFIFVWKYRSRLFAHLSIGKRDIINLKRKTYFNWMTWNPPQIGIHKTWHFKGLA